MSGHSAIAWVMVSLLALAGVVAGVSATAPVAVLLAAAFFCLLVAIVGMRERSALVAANASRSAIESLTARRMSYVWLWGAIAIFAVYVFQLSWREWPHFFAAFAVAGLVSLGYSALLARDAKEGKEDEAMLSLGRYLCVAQLVGMIVTVIGLAIDPDKEFIYIKETDWAGNGVFLLGATSLALLSAHALATSKRRDT